MRVTNLEQPFHPIYNYAVITDAKEGSDPDRRDDAGRRRTAQQPPRSRVDVESAAAFWRARGTSRSGGYYAYVIADTGLVIVNLNDPLQPSDRGDRSVDGRTGASALQFRYLFVTDRDGLKMIDVTDPTAPRLVADNTIPIKAAHRVYVARTYAYVAAGDEGIVIVDAERPEHMQEYVRFNADGASTDSRDVIVATTNASLFGYVADGEGGLKVLQLTSPESQPKFYGFSPEPKPQLIASYRDAQARPCAVEGSRSRPRRRRNRRTDRGVWSARLATLQPRRNAADVSRRQRSRGRVIDQPVGADTLTRRRCGARCVAIVALAHLRDRGRCKCDQRRCPSRCRKLRDWCMPREADAAEGQERLAERVSGLVRGRPPRARVSDAC